MLKSPQNLAEQVRPMIEKLGGKLEGYWSCFGDYDTVLIVQAPDNIGAAALSLAAAGGGALRSLFYIHCSLNSAPKKRLSKRCWSPESVIVSKFSVRRAS
jgi:uncharacterized protein with GYD domain